MLLFKPEHVKSIDNGLKTETRRTWKKPRAKVGSTHKAKTKMLSKNYFAVLKIKEVYQEKLRSITKESAYAEGGYTVESYVDKFYEINPKENRANYAFVWLWVVKFEKVAPGNLPIDSKEFT
jgi:hypothetical protein